MPFVAYAGEMDRYHRDANCPWGPLEMRFVTEESVMAEGRKVCPKCRRRKYDQRGRLVRSEGR